MFDELAESLDCSLESLSEVGFVNTYVALTINKFAVQKPKQHRTALSELEHMLDNNLERLSLDALADLLSLFISILKA